MLLDIKGYFAGVLPDRGVVRPPPRRCPFRQRTTPRRALGLSQWKPPDLRITIRKMPCDQDGIGSRFTRSQPPCKQNRTAIPSSSIDFIGAIIGSEGRC